MLAFNAQGFPSATASKERYLRAIEEQGFGVAHAGLLEEAKQWLSDHGHNTESSAGEGKLIHYAAIYHAKEAGVPVPSRGALCILLMSTFGDDEAKIVAEERAGAQTALRQFMLETGQTDEGEARQQLVDAAVKAAVENARRKAAAAG